MAFGAKVVKKRPLFGRSRKSNGEKVRVGTEITTADGEIKTLLTPSGRASKFVAEIKNDTRYTNNGEVKLGKSGKPMKLTKEQKAYRAGYLSARSESAKIFNRKNKSRKG